MNSADIKVFKCKPFLKWVGGKTQLLSHIEKYLVDKKINTYYEPFVGGGSVLIHVLGMLESKKIQIQHIKISDLNRDLINLYKHIKTNHEELLERIDYFKTQYDNAPVVKHPTRHKPELTNNIQEMVAKSKTYVYYYYRQRYREHKDSPIDISALFIVINKLCWRGLYRTGPNGFNTPYGNYKNPKMYIRENIEQVSNLFNKYNVEFTHQDYSTIQPNSKDYVYLDPPYFPIKKNAFESYTVDGFDHKKFVNFTINLNAPFLMSNAYCKFINDSFVGFIIKKILCKRRINSKNPKDSDYEVLVSRDEETL